ncbi:hypothetical protein [Haloplanus sp. C73]|uniref:hypothetical protein n=1 Tax=Haloplanus sp. C73 TaxID=3421641 RepID=UPI003EBBFDED
MVWSQLGAVAGFAVVVLLCCSPLLALSRLRDLFRWPTEWLAVNYLLVGGVLVGVQSLSYLGIMLLVAGTGTVTGGDAAGIVAGVLAANLCLPGGVALAALRLLPERGYWTPDGDGLSGRVALGIGVVWYAAVTSVGFVLVGLTLLFANLPT